MTMSSLALAAKQVIDAAWLHGPAYDLSSQAAFALEAACLLQLPVSAGERAAGEDAVRVAEEALVELRREHEENARLRARVAELELERHSTNKALDDAVQELRRRDAVEQQVGPHRQAIGTANMHHIARQELRLRRVRFLHIKHTDSEHCQHDGEAWPCPTLTALDAPVGEVCHPCGCPKRFARHADGCTAQNVHECDADPATFCPGCAKCPHESVHGAGCASFSEEAAE